MNSLGRNQEGSIYSALWIRTNEIVFVKCLDIHHSSPWVSRTQSTFRVDHFFEEVKLLRYSLPLLSSSPRFPLLSSLSSLPSSLFPLLSSLSSLPSSHFHSLFTSSVLSSFLFSILIPILHPHSHSPSSFLFSILIPILHSHSYSPSSFLFSILFSPSFPI